MRFIAGLFVFVLVNPGDVFGQPLMCDSFEDEHLGSCDLSGPCPQGMALIENFCIDRWEASITNQSPYHFPDTPGPPDRVAISEPGKVPQGHISGESAELYCDFSGKRLCTSQEWLRACKGPDDWTYPYGNIHQPGTCNDFRAEHPLTTLYGAGNEDWGDVNNPLLNQLPDTVDLTGQNGMCVTPEGVFDLVGNLNEWVADVSGINRGGNYIEALVNGEGCNWRSTVHSFQYFDFLRGFRCCADSEP